MSFGDTHYKLRRHVLPLRWISDAARPPRNSPGAGGAWRLPCARRSDTPTHFGEVSLDAPLATLCSCSQPGSRICSLRFRCHALNALAAITMSVLAPYVPYRFAVGHRERCRTDVARRALGSVGRFCSNVPGVVLAAQGLDPLDMEREIARLADLFSRAKACPPRCGTDGWVPGRRYWASSGAAPVPLRMVASTASRAATRLRKCERPVRSVDVQLGSRSGGCLSWRSGHEERTGTGPARTHCQGPSPEFQFRRNTGMVRSHPRAGRGRRACRPFRQVC